MALLADALRASTTHTARCVAPDGTEVMVQRMIGKEEPWSEESYTVRAYRGMQPPLVALEAEDLVEAIERLRGLNIPGFDPDAADWAPSVGPQSVDTTPQVRAP